MTEAGQQLLVENDNDCRDQALKSDVTKLLVELLPALKKPSNRKLLDELVSRCLDALHRGAGATIEQRKLQLLLLVLVIGKAMQELQHSFSWNIETLLQLLQARKRPYAHLRALLPLMLAAKLLTTVPNTWTESQSVPAPSDGVLYMLTAQGEGFPVVRGFQLSQFQRQLAQEKAQAELAQQVEQLQSEAQGITSDVLKNKLRATKCVMQWLTLCISDLKDLQESGFVSTAIIQQVISRLGPLAGKLLFSPPAAAAEQQLQQLVDLLQQLSSSAMKHLVLQRPMQMYLKSEAPASVAGGGDFTSCQQSAYKLHLTDGAESLLAAIDQLDARGSDDSSAASTKSNLHVTSDDGSGSVGYQQVQHSKEGQVFLIGQHLEECCRHSSLGGDSKMPIKLQQALLMFQTWRREVYIVLHGPQASGAALPGEPLDVMLWNVSAEPASASTAAGPLHNQQTADQVTLMSLKKSLETKWNSELVEFKINRFSRFGPSAEVTLAISEDSAKPLKLCITIGAIPGVLQETAYVAHQLAGSRRLRFAVHTTLSVIQESRAVYLILGRSPAPHAVVQMLLVFISKLPEEKQKWWGVNLSADLLPDGIMFNAQQLQQHLQSSFKPALQTPAETLQMLHMLQMFWEYMGLVSYVQECLAWSNKKATTIAVAAAQTESMASQVGQLQDYQQRQQCIAIFRMYQRWSIDAAALEPLRLIFRHAASSLSRYLAAAPDPGLQTILRTCTTCCSEQDTSLLITCHTLSMLVAGNTELQQLLDRRKPLLCVWGTPIRELANDLVLPAARKALAALDTKNHRAAYDSLEAADRHIADVLGQAAAAGDVGLRAAMHSVWELGDIYRLIVEKVEEEVDHCKNAHIVAAGAKPCDYMTVAALKAHYEQTVTKSYDIHRLHRSSLLMLKQVHEAANAADRTDRDRRRAKAPAVVPVKKRLERFDEVLAEVCDLHTSRQQQQQQQQQQAGQ